jgi:hypothetical protein
LAWLASKAILAPPVLPVRWDHKAPPDPPDLRVRKVRSDPSVRLVSRAQPERPGPLVRRARMVALVRQASPARQEKTARPA